MQRQQGFSLLEVLIAAAILSVGFSSLSLLSLLSISTTSAARDQTVASLLAADRATLQQLGATTMAAGHTIWLAQLGQALPNGFGIVCQDSTALDGAATAPACNGIGPWVVKVFWQRAGEPAQRFVLVANP